MAIYPSRDSTRFIHIICLVFLVGGIALRILHFVFNRGLWGDESMLVVNFIDRDLSGLTRTLHYFQQAPIGVLWTQKLVVSLLGISEMSLRFFPLLCGILSLILFFLWIRREVKSVGLLLATGLFAFAHPLIYHSVEAKQYATEVLAAVTALWLYARLSTRQDVSSQLYWALGGALLIWFSYTVVFILAGISIVLGLTYLLRKDWSRVMGQFLVSGFWMLNFLLNYFLFMRAGVQSEGLKQYWLDKDSFMPLSSRSVTSLSGFRTFFVWTRKTVFRFIDYPLGIDLTQVLTNGLLYQLLFVVILAMLLVFIAVGYRQKAERLLILLVPIVLTLFASALLVYPFFQRSVVFLAPAVILLLAAGVDAVAEKSKLPTFVAGLAALVFIVVFPLRTSLDQALHPHHILHYTEAREGLDYIHRNVKAGEIVVVHHRLYSQYEFYSKLNRIAYTAHMLTEQDPVAGNKNDIQVQIGNKLNGYMGRKVWVLLPRNVQLGLTKSKPGNSEANDYVHILEVFNQRGTLQTQRNFIQESVYLYAL
jgi:hypothetical protein